MIVDAHWFATNGIVACFDYTMHVLAAIEDVDAAIAARDWEIAIDCIGRGYLQLARVEAALHGCYTPDTEGPAIAAAVLSSFGGAAEALPPVGGASAEECAEIAAAFRAACDRTRARLPIELPPFRTASGFYPALRLAKELEKVRKAVGLDPFAWDLGL